MKQAIFTVLLLFVIVMGSFSQTTNVPPLMNYQGRLSNPDGTAVVDGSYKIKFSIYNQATEGVEKWYQVMEPVIVKNGVFAVLLGNGNPLSATVFEGNSYLEIKVGEDSPLSPRQQIVSVGYAFKADMAKEADHAISSTIADTVKDGAITTGKLSDGAVTNSKLSNDAISSMNIADGSITSEKLGPACYDYIYGRPDNMIYTPTPGATFDVCQGEILIPGPGKIMITTSVSLKPNSFEWAGIDILLQQGNELLKNGDTAYVGGNVLIYSNVSNNAVVSVPRGGTWKVLVKLHASHLVQVHTFCTTAVYLGQ